MRRARRPRPRESGTFSLNITSMCDMFTLLLVFLLQSYGTAEFQPELDAAVSLPVSSAMKDPNKIPQVTITRDAVKVDGEIVAVLREGVPLASDMDPSNPALVKPMLEALRGKAPAVASETDAVLLQADSKQTMTSLNPFLSTISAAGFAKVKLATVLGR